MTPTPPSASNSCTLRILVVGGGQAAARVCEGIVSCGGGRPHAVTVVGDEPALPYERPPLSKDALSARGTLPPARLGQDYYRMHGIELMLGRRVVRIDRTRRYAEIDDGSRLGYDRLVIATGSRVRRLGLAAADESRLNYLRTIADAEQLRRRLRLGVRVGILGAGFIGLEVAAAARRQGCDVTVFEREPRVLARVMPEVVGAAVERHHRTDGVRFALGAPAEVAGAPGARGFVVRTPACDHLVDELVVGIGVLPNLELARSAGIECEQGVLVDELGRTSVEDIYAAGEVTQHPIRGANGRLRRESWQVAENQAYAVGRTVAGCPMQDDSIPWFWSDQGDLNLQVAGHLDAGADQLLRGDPLSNAFCLFALRGEHLVGVAALNARREVSAARRMIEAGVRVDRSVLADVSRPLRGAPMAVKA